MDGDVLVAERAALRPVKRAAPLKQQLPVFLSVGVEEELLLIPLEGSPPRKKGGPIEAWLLLVVSSLPYISPPRKKGGPIEALMTSSRSTQKKSVSPPRKKGGPIEAASLTIVFFLFATLRPVKRAAPLKLTTPLAGPYDRPFSPPRKKGGPIEAVFSRACVAEKMSLRPVKRAAPLKQVLTQVERPPLHLDSPPRKKGGPIEAHLGSLSNTPLISVLSSLRPVKRAAPLKLMVH